MEHAYLSVYRFESGQILFELHYRNGELFCQMKDGDVCRIWLSSEEAKEVLQALPVRTAVYYEKNGDAAGAKQEYFVGMKFSSADGWYIHNGWGLSEEAALELASLCQKTVKEGLERLRSSSDSSEHRSSPTSLLKGSGHASKME